MIEGYASQFRAACVRLEPTDVELLEADDVIEFAWQIGAHAPDGDDECLIVEFPGRPGPELYTERALQRSLGAARG